MPSVFSRKLGKALCPIIDSYVPLVQVCFTFTGIEIKAGYNKPTNQSVERVYRFNSVKRKANSY